MATTTRQDQEFLRQSNLDDILSQALDYLADHMAPEDVFSDDVLAEWATNNGFTKEAT